MKRLISMVIIAGAFTLTACSDAPATPPAPVTQTVTETPTPTPNTGGFGSNQPTDLPEQISQSQAVSQLRASSEFWTNIEDAQIIEYFGTICDTLDNGATFEQVIQTQIDNGVPAFDAGAALGAAVVSTCYSYTPSLVEFLEENS